MIKTIAIASDHAGYLLKEKLKVFLKAEGYECQDLGTDSEESVDYPDFAKKVGDVVAKKQADCGVLICGSGIGISIAANRNPKIRAALCHNAEIAKLSRQHNDANILVLGSRIVDEKTAIECLKTFIDTDFEAGRHIKRVEKLGNI
ncbi:ribose 5-phosphate isomerase B [Rickettsiales bacterium]|nr:ribose 5-phosphate isomerase B [Rickettsiales bacterium]